MTPFHFGQAAEPLFGYFHAPAVERPEPAGAVLCPPALHEYMAAHRTLKQLAGRLAQRGIAALRFDLYGTGDSSGEAIDARPEQWERDLDTARLELGRRIGGHAPSIVGLRFGAALALRHLTAPDVDETPALVLWDPILDGAAYVEELTALQRERYGDDSPEVLGFPFSAEFRADMTALDLREALPPRARRLLVIETGGGDTSTRAFVERCRRAGTSVEHRAVAGEPWWREPGKAFVPMQTVQAVVSWLHEG